MQKFIFTYLVYFGDERTPGPSLWNSLENTSGFSDL